MKVIIHRPALPLLLAGILLDLRVVKAQRRSQEKEVDDREPVKRPPQSAATRTGASGIIRWASGRRW
jgi:hypothetical protein